MNDRVSTPTFAITMASGNDAVLTTAATVAVLVTAAVVVAVTPGALVSLWCHTTRLTLGAIALVCAVLTAWTTAVREAGTAGESVDLWIPRPLI